MFSSKMPSHLCSKAPQRSSRARLGGSVLVHPEPSPLKSKRQPTDPADHLGIRRFRVLERRQNKSWIRLVLGSKMGRHIRPATSSD